MRSLLALLIVLASPAWPGVNAAWADAGLKQARALNRQGMTKYRLGEYEKAAKLFKDAYETHPDPKILFNLAQSYRKNRDYAKALETYRSYLASLPAAKNRAEVEAIVVELEGLLAAERESDKKPPEGVTAAPSVEPERATTRAFASKDPGAPSTNGTRWYQDTVAWSLAGGGLALAAVGTGLYIQAQGQKDDLLRTPESARDELRDDIGRNQTIGGMAMILGGAVIATSVVKFILTERAFRGNELHLAVGATSLRVAGAF